MVKRLVAPPRLLEWTKDVMDAQPFESKREATDCAEYITKSAFNVEVFDLDKEQLFSLCNKES